LAEVTISGSEELNPQAVSIYPVTRVMGKAEIEISFTPQQKVAGARLRALEARRFEDLVIGTPAVRAPQLVSRTCGACGPFHQIASCMAIESACGIEIPPQAAALRELVAWLLTAVSHLTTITFMVLPDFALPMSDAAVKNVTGIYMVDQESISRLSRVTVSICEAARLLTGSEFRVPVIVPGGASMLPDQETVDRASGLLASCEDDLHETVRLAEMLTRRESRIVDSGTRLPGYYACSSAGGHASLIGDCLSVGSFSGGEPSPLSFEDFLSSIEQRPVPWSYLVGLALRDREPAMVGPLARVNVGFRDETPSASLERQRAIEQWDFPFSSEFFFLMALALESVWCWESARGLLAGEDLAGDEPCAKVQMRASEGSAVIDSPRGVVVHSVGIDEAGGVETYEIMSPLQFNAGTIDEHLSRVARDSVASMEISEAAASRLQLAVRSFNPCVACGTH
jgi:coenzyme F420-reducing hydrogenase alpha subunit